MNKVVLCIRFLFYTVALMGLIWFIHPYPPALFYGSCYECPGEGDAFLKLWVNSLWSSDAIWRHRSGSTLAQVMAWCLTAPSHYLNPMLAHHQCGPATFIWGQFHKSQPSVVCSMSLMASLIRSVGSFSKCFYQGLWLADLIADVIGQSTNKRGIT